MVWSVITAHFKQHGLVSQQIDSFNHFIRNTIRQIIAETPAIEIKPEKQ